MEDWMIHLPNASTQLLNCKGRTKSHYSFICNNNSVGYMFWLINMFLVQITLISLIII